MLFDCIVIGKGLIGSAAARHLSLEGKAIAIIGPDEPSSHNSNSLVYASHYDQARIQRLIGTDEIWTQLNLQSIKQYDLLQRENNIRFHTKPGCLYVNPYGKDHYLQQASVQSDRFQIPVSFFDTALELDESFPDFKFPATASAMFEPSPSGYINPRQLICAQLSSFKKNKGIVIIDTAIDIKHHNDQYEIITHSGKAWHAKKVLLTPGAFVNFFNLTEKKLNLKLKSETILLAKISDAEAQRLTTLPSLLYEIDEPDLKNIYLIRPVQYPDGHYYIKMGCNLPEDSYFENLPDVQKWFTSGNSDASKEKMKNALLTIMPTLKSGEFKTSRCIITRTTHGKAYIGAIDKNLFVVAGCNGYSAMCSDALGSIASQLIISNVFPKEYTTGAFQPVYIN